MRNLLRALRRRYLTRGLTPDERARLDALPAARWPTPEEFALDVDDLRARFVAQLDRKIRAAADPPWSRPDAAPLADMQEAARRAHENWLPVDENTAARAEVATGLVPATHENVTATLYPPPPDPERAARLREEDRAKRELDELDRMKTERIRYEIDWTREQWLTLVKHGIDPGLPRHVAGGRIVAGLLPADDRGGFRVVDVPTRHERICELDGVEIDGHEPSDLDPLGGCMHCGKKEIYGEGDDGRPLRFDDDAVWPFADGCAR